MSASFIDPLPGVPNVESPFFKRFFPEATTDAITLRVANDLRENGFAVLDFPDPDFDEVAERIKKDLQGQYNWKAWRKGEVDGLRIQDAWLGNRDVARIASNHTMLELIEKVYGREPFPFQSLSFPVGTQQHFHTDSIHFSSMPERFMCGVWVALEDIGLDQGPLIYYPGSHKWPIYGNAATGITNYLDPGGDQRRYEPLWEQLVDIHEVQPQRFFAKKGQALIWAANLLHGGDRHLDKNRTRWSQVTHYYFKGTSYYTPMSSDEPTRQIHYREPYNILTGSTEKNAYNGIERDLVDLGMQPMGDNALVKMNAVIPKDFDSGLYLRLNPDVAAAGANAVEHYVRFGITEGRQYC